MYLKNGLKLVEIKDKNTWNKFLDNFQDANIYQTWNFPRFALSENNFQHLSFFNGDELVGLALVRLKFFPLINKGIAYIFRGPLWQVKNRENSFDNLINIFVVLYDEYIKRQNFFLRVRPFLFISETDQRLSLDHFGFINNSNINPYRSLRLSLLQSLEEIQSSFRRTWRQELHKAIKKNLNVISGTDNNLFKTFLDTYHQMHDRKKFNEYVDVDRLLFLQNYLEEKYRLNIFIALSESKPVASLVVSAIGHTGIAISGGTNELGLQTKASYLLQWEAIKWLKSINCDYYDLGGINKVKNPGGYLWKSGISRTEIQEIGIFDACNDRLSRIIINLIDKYKSIRKTK